MDVTTAAQLGLFDARPQDKRAQPADICRRKHGGNANSEAANTTVAPYKASMRERMREGAAVLVSQRGWVNGSARA